MIGPHDTLVILTENGEAYGGRLMNHRDEPVPGYEAMSIREAISYLHQRGRSIELAFHPAVEGLPPENRGKAKR